MSKKSIIAIFALLAATAPAHAINAKYRQQLIDSGCTQMSELQGCDINKTKAENAAAGFVTTDSTKNTNAEQQTNKSPYTGSWLAVLDENEHTLAEIHIDSNENVTVNGTTVKAKRSDGALVFTQGVITYTIQGDRRLKGEDYWLNIDKKTKGPIDQKK